MSSVRESTTAVLEAVLATRPEVLEHLSAADRAARRVVDERTLDLCRARVGMLLDAPIDGGGLDPATIDALPAWPTSATFSEPERACLAFTEQFVIDVAAMPDELADAVVDALGDQGFADFVNALLVVEQRQRLRLIWDRLFAEEAA